MSIFLLIIFSTESCIFLDINEKIDQLTIKSKCLLTTERLFNVSIIKKNYNHEITVAYFLHDFLSFKFFPIFLT